MYIAPGSRILLFSDVPFDPDYNNTLYFDTAAQQTAFFDLKTTINLVNQTYQDLSKGFIRIEKTAEQVWICTYMAWQNTPFSGKWFYAFIDRIEYINNETCQVYYTLDVIQTYHFNYGLGMCFVEREHAAVDTPGSNLVPERLTLGDYVSGGLIAAGELLDLSIIVAANFDENYNNVAGGLYGSLYSGLVYHRFPNTPDGALAATNFINNAGSKASGIVSVFLMPTAFTTNKGGAVNRVIFSVDKLIDGAIDGYTPKNKKLYTYPYNFLYVTTLQGNSAVYPYEYFSSQQCIFTAVGDYTASPSVVLQPRDYKGAAVNYDEQLVLSGYPQLSFNTDVFKAFIAQHATNTAVNALAAGTTAAVTQDPNLINGWVNQTVTGTVGIAAQVAINSLLSAVAPQYAMPNQAHNGSGSTTSCALRQQTFWAMQKHIRPEFMQIIDEYFNLYGYATHRVKVPNRNVRANWCYTKTVGCYIGSNNGVPADAEKQICRIYDKGIRFWKNPVTFGNYDVDNTPIGG